MKYTLRELRARKRYSQEDLANIIGVATPTLSKYETSVRTLRAMKFDTVQKIADEFEIEVSDIDMDRI